ncbi:MAG TPA: hypothetical protein VGM75_13710 [Pseudonocardiaceae bacterium]|jgi:hypothetical protein
MAGIAEVGRHRLGKPGLVHCVTYRQVADVLSGRRVWWQRLLTPARAAVRMHSRHSLAGLRRRAVAVAMERAWVPSPAIG